MIEEFVDSRIYRSSIEHAMKIGAYIWHDENNILVVKREFAQDVITYALYD
jgi:hypothetical protein